ncbi:MAG: hypothetical protein A3H79_03750 [Candidatus Levybacteria bacterium RIFCSPLOWO2_02_FULL_36_8b]|nr:MAG: hypothetical protein A3H79_03750 [Candidatus Levybacteria bacterium RIFCSPLOWO2_02_FULL_36_8b]
MAVKKTIKKTTKIPAMPVPLTIEKSSVKDKLKQPKIFVPLIIIILIITAFLLKGFFIAALVNGEPIARFSVIRELEKQSGRQALSALVNQTLILQEARRKNVQATEKEINDSVKQIEDSLKKQGQNLNAALAAQGLARQDFLMQLKLRNLVEKLLADKIKITDKEAADYIEKNKETLPSDLKEDEIKKGVREQLRQQKLASKSQEWLTGLEKNAKINYFVNY